MKKPGIWINFPGILIFDTPIINILYWVIQHAAEYNLSLGDVIDSLNAANSKGKQGKMCYWSA